jgi:hypothetical protein
VGANGPTRGGAFSDQSDALLPSELFALLPDSESIVIGFRVSSLAPIPEPSTYAVMLGGLGLLMALMRRKGRVLS